MTTRPPITARVQHLRQRRRSDGSWRVWWEPSAAGRELGLEPVELDADRPTWSVREAGKLNEDFQARRRGEQPVRSGPGGRTITALIASYKQDLEYLSKREKTRASYDANLRLIARKWGDQPVASFSKAILRQWYLTLRKTAGETQAVRLLGMFSILMNHAEMIEWRAEDSNPCRSLKMQVPKPRQRVATWQELDALVAAADKAGLASVGTACLLSALQGQRQTDVLAAQRRDMRRIDGGVWAWQVDRSKRGTLGLMQLHPFVVKRLGPFLLLDGGGPDDRVLTDERTGQPYSVDLFGARFEEVRAAAAKAVPSVTGRHQLQFRDLRRTFAVLSRAGGASDDDVGDVLGNSAALDPRLQETYMPASYATASRAVLAIRRPEPEERKKA